MPGDSGGERRPSPADDFDGARPAVGRSDRHHGGHHNRWRAGRADLEHGPEDRRSDSAAARARPASDGTNRRDAPVRPGSPLRRRHLVRLRAAAGHRHADGARFQPGLRRSRRDPARHLSGPAQRVLFRDESIGRPRGRPGREWTVERRLGCHLGRAHQTHGSGMDRGVRDSFQEPELPGRADRMGLQHRPPRLSKAGGGSLVGCSSGHAAVSGLRGRRNHESCRTDAGDWSRRPAVSRGALAATSVAGTTSTASRGSTCFTTSRPA